MKRILILSLAIFAFAACSNDASKPAESAVEVPQMPAIILPALAGGNLDFSAQIQNKPTLVAVMAGFCGYCKKMLPYVENIANTVNPKDVDVMVTFIDPSSDTIKDLEPVKAVKKAKVYYNAGAVQEENKVGGFPTIILFKNGKEVQTWRGYNPAYEAEIIKAIEGLKEAK